MKEKNSTINVQGTSITILSYKEDDYISITDMLKAKDGDFFISDWLRNRNTVEFLGVWESVYNPLFNYGEFAIIKSHAGLNSYKLSVREWVEKTNAIGVKAKAGRYGGTYAHKDIAFEFGMWMSAEFKIYFIKEFQRLKEDENQRLSLAWNLNRMLSKLNYRIHTEAIKENIIPPDITKAKQHIIYSNEADVLNMAMFGKTAGQWRKENPGKEGNIRDYSSIEQLLVLANMESLNAEFIRMNLLQGDCLKKLNVMAISQMKSLTSNTALNKLKATENKKSKSTCGARLFPLINRYQSDSYPDNPFFARPFALAFTEM